MTSFLELEVKFYLENMDGLQRIFAGSSACLIQPRTHERNLRFDTPSEHLTKNSQVLRLRQDRSDRLTYKGPSLVKDGVSAREEIEVTVGSFDHAKRLLEALGYQVSMIYEKYRTVYELNNTLVTLDEMPFGNFAEIEGKDGDSIQDVCHQLGLSWDARTLDSYAVLFQIAMKNLGIQMRDLTFENFAEIKVGPAHLGLIAADKSNDGRISEPPFS
jgi:adenylate cyclase class 2